MLVKCCVVSCLDIVLNKRGGEGVRIGTTVLNLAHTYGVRRNSHSKVTLSVVKIQVVNNNNITNVPEFWKFPKFPEHYHFRERYLRVRGVC